MQFIGTKDEVVKQLRDRAAECRKIARNMDGAGKAEQKGIATGYDAAALFVEQWQAPKPEPTPVTESQIAGGPVIREFAHDERR